jgi:hypothetical protein
MIRAASLAAKCMHCFIHSEVITSIRDAHAGTLDATYGH